MVSNLDIINALRAIDLGSFDNYAHRNWRNGAYEDWVAYLSGEQSYDDYLTNTADLSDYYRLLDAYGVTTDAVDWTEDGGTSFFDRDFLGPLAGFYYRYGDQADAAAYIDILARFAETEHLTADRVYGPGAGAYDTLAVSSTMEATFFALKIIANRLGEPDGELSNDAWINGAIAANTAPLSAETIAFIPEGQLADIAAVLATHYVEPVLDAYIDNPMTPNQRLHGITSAKKLATAFEGVPEFDALSTKIDEGLVSLLDEIVQLDGGYTEPSFNYNALMTLWLKSLIALDPDADWVARVEQTYQESEIFMEALLSPFGTLPQVGNNIWETSGDDSIDRDFDTSVALPYSGFYVQRSDESEEADYLFFYGARELIGHATAGGNSIQLAAMGDQLLVSGGRPNYFDDAVLYPNSKDYLAEPSGYKTNTVLVDGYSQKIAVTFDGAHEDPLAGRWLDSDHFDYVEGVWDLGYVNHKNLSDTLDSNVAHQRKVIYLEDESIWIVVDTMTAEQAHEFTQVWKLAPPEVTDDVQTGGFTPDQVATQENQNAILASGITDDSTSLRIQQFGADFTYETHYGEDGGDYGYYGSLYSGEPDFSVDVHATFAPVSEADQNSVSVISILQSFQGAEAGVSYQDVSQGGTAGVVLEFASGRTLEISASPELRDLSVAGVAKSDVDLLIVDRFGDEKAILVTGDPNDTSASYQIADDQRIEIRSPETFAWDVADNGAATPQILNDPDSAISAYFQVGAQAHWDQHIGSLSAGDTIFADETAGGYAIDLRDSGTADVMLRTREAPYQADIATVISSGSSGHDTILGGQNADVIAGGQGVDRLAGREGADIFVFASDAGSKIIYDFTDGEDLIFFDGVDFAEVTVADYRDDHTLLSHGDTRMILRDFDHSDFSHSNTADTLDI